MSFFSRFKSKFRKDGAASRIEPTSNQKGADPAAAGQATVPAINTEADPGVGVTEPHADQVAPRKSLDMRMRTRSGEKAKTDATREVIVGLQVAGSESWLRLSADGHADEISDLPASSAEATRIFGGARIFRGMDYDRGIHVSTKLRGKALRNNLARELSDMPVWFKKEGISWFTRSGSQAIFGYPVRPLAAALWQFVKSRGAAPSSGVLLRIRIPVGSTLLWAFLAIGANGVGTFQSMRTSSSANRPTFNPQLASGVLGNDFQSLDVDAAELWAFLASSPASKVTTYPQLGDWLGKPKTLIGRFVAVGGLSALVIGAGFWFWSETTLHQAQDQEQAEAMRIAQFKATRQAFFSTHIEGITLLQKIPLSRLMRDAVSLWKPGTTVTMADGMPLSMEAGPSLMLARPGSVGVSGNSGALFQVGIPATKNLGPGQAFWVSQSLLRAVISQTPPQGIVLQSVQKTGGNGYVALFGGH